MIAGPRSTALGAVIAGLLGPVGALASGCIIPDSGIIVDDEFLNPGGVRIVEPTPVTPRADEECDRLTPLGGCPPPVNTIPAGLIKPFTPLCVCPSGRDSGLGSFDIFVEDPDTDEDGDPKDDILGALFLDMPADATNPQSSLAYTALLPPDEPARRVRQSDVQTIERPDPHLKNWTLAGQPQVDLCNDNDGTPLQPGTHQLRVIVTDRPWYRPVLLDAEGAVLLDDEGESVLGDPVIGMPDLAAGASYDTATYVFQCFDGFDMVEGMQCNCED